MYTINSHTAFSEALPGKSSTHNFFPHHYDLPCGDVYLITPAGDIMFISVESEESTCIHNAKQTGLFPCYYNPIHWQQPNGYPECIENLTTKCWAFSEDCLMVLFASFNQLTSNFCIVFKHGNILYKGQCDPRGVPYTYSRTGSNYGTDNIPTIQQQYQWRRASLQPDGTLKDDPNGKYCGQGNSKSLTWDWVTLKSTSTSSFDSTNKICMGWTINPHVPPYKQGIYLFNCVAGEACGNSCQSGIIPSDIGEFSTNHNGARNFSNASCVPPEGCYCQMSVSQGIEYLDEEQLSYGACLIDLGGGFSLIPLKNSVPRFKDFTYIGNINDPSELPGVININELNILDQNALNAYQLHYQNLNKNEIINPDPENNLSTVTRIGIQINDVFRYNNSYYKFTSNGWKLYQDRWTEDYIHRNYSKYLLIKPTDASQSDLQDNLDTCPTPNKTRIVTGINVNKCGNEWIIVNDFGDSSLGTDGRYFLLNLISGNTYEGIGNAGIKCIGCFAIVTTSNADGTTYTVFGQNATPLFSTTRDSDDTVKWGNVGHFVPTPPAEDLPNQYLTIYTATDTGTKNAVCCKNSLVGEWDINDGYAWLGNEKQIAFNYTYSRFYGLYAQNSQAVVIEGCNIIYEGVGRLMSSWFTGRFFPSAMLTGKCTGHVNKRINEITYSQSPTASNYCQALQNPSQGGQCLQNQPPNYLQGTCSDLMVKDQCGNNGINSGSVQITYLFIDFVTGKSTNYPMPAIQWSSNTCSPSDCGNQQFDDWIASKEVDLTTAPSGDASAVFGVTSVPLPNTNALGHAQSVRAGCVYHVKDVNMIYCTDTGSTLDFYLFDDVTQECNPISTGHLCPYGWNRYAESTQSSGGTTCVGVKNGPRTTEFQFYNQSQYCSRLLGSQQKVLADYTQNLDSNVYLMSCRNEAVLGEGIIAVVKAGANGFASIADVTTSKQCVTTPSATDQCIWNNEINDDACDTGNTLQWNASLTLNLNIFPRYFAITADGNVLVDNNGGHKGITAYPFGTFVANPASACTLPDLNYVKDTTQKTDSNNACSGLAAAMYAHQPEVRLKCRDLLNGGTTYGTTCAIENMSAGYYSFTMDCASKAFCNHYTISSGTLSFKGANIKNYGTSGTLIFLSCCATSDINGTEATITKYTNGANILEELWIDGISYGQLSYASTDTSISSLGGCNCGFIYIKLGLNGKPAIIEPNYYTSNLTSINDALNIPAGTDFTLRCCQGYGWAISSGQPEPNIAWGTQNNPLGVSAQTDIEVTNDNLDSFLSNPNCTIATFDDGTKAVGKWNKYHMELCDGTDGGLTAWIENWYFRGIDGVFKEVQNYYRTQDNPMALQTSLSTWIPFEWIVKPRKCAIYKISITGQFAGLLASDEGLINAQCNFYNSELEEYEGLNASSISGGPDQFLDIQFTWPPLSEVICEPLVIVNYNTMRIRKSINNPYNAIRISAVQPNPYMRYSKQQLIRSEHISEKGALTNTLYNSKIEILKTNVITTQNSDFENLEQKSLHDKNQYPNSQGYYFTVGNDREAIKAADQIMGTTHTFTDDIVHDLKTPQSDQTRSVFSENNVLWILDKELGLLKYDLWGNLLT